MENLDKRTDKEVIEIYDMVVDEINDMLSNIYKKTGYYATGDFSLFAEEPKKCMGIEMDISLLEMPHGLTAEKVEYYKKVNPDNVLNKSIRAHKHNSWYMIYDGCHRTEANKQNGKETIKVDILIPKPDKE